MSEILPPPDSPGHEPSADIRKPFLNERHIEGLDWRLARAATWIERKIDPEDIERSVERRAEKRITGRALDTIDDIVRGAYPRGDVRGSDDQWWDRVIRTGLYLGAVFGSKAIYRTQRLRYDQVIQESIAKMGGAVASSPYDMEDLLVTKYANSRLVKVLPLDIIGAYDDEETTTIMNRSSSQLYHAAFACAARPGVTMLLDRIISEETRPLQRDKHRSIRKGLTQSIIEWGVRPRPQSPKDAAP